MRALTFGTLLVAASLLHPRRALAQDASGPFATGYVHGFASVGYGRGIRFNNPYRLQTELGAGASSLSLTAGYWDFGLGATLGRPNGFQHGLVTHLSVAANGVAQEVVSVSYLIERPLGRDFLGFARLGLPFVIRPDFGAGYEAALGGAYLFTSGLGVSAELVESLFLGAATWEHDPSVWPVTSLQVGLWVDYEVLP